LWIFTSPRVTFCFSLLFCRRILLDTGEKEKPDYIENLNRTLEEEKAEIELILITHWHRDHIGGVPDILKHVQKGMNRTSTSIFYKYYYFSKDLFA